MLWAKTALLMVTFELKQDCLTSFPAIVNYVLKWFETDNSIATAEAETLNFKQESLMAKNYAQHLWRKMLSCCSVDLWE